MRLTEYVHCLHDADTVCHLRFGFTQPMAGDINDPATLPQFFHVWLSVLAAAVLRRWERLRSTIRTFCLRTKAVVPHVFAYGI